MKKFLLNLFAAMMVALGVNAQTAPPSGVEQQEYSFFGIFHAPDEADETVEEPVKVAVDGTDLYVQLPNPINGLAWIKGTIDYEAGTATFAKQKIGKYSGMNFYVTALNENNEVGDIVFSYSESMMSCPDQYIQLSDDLAGKNVYAYFTGVIINREVEDDPVVEAPAGLKTSPYVFTGQSLQYDEENNFTGYEEVTRNVQVGFYNNNKEVYVQGLCSQLPEAWVKGTVEEGSFGDMDVTFEAGQCYGRYGLYQLYLAARYGQEFSDMKFYYDPQDRTFTNEGGVYLVLNAAKSSPAPIEQYATVKLTPGTVDGITVNDNQTPATIGYTDLQGRKVSANTKGVVLKTLRMGDGSLKTVKMVRR